MTRNPFTYVYYQTAMQDKNNKKVGSLEISTPVRTLPKDPHHRGPERYSTVACWSMLSKNVFTRTAGFFWVSLENLLIFYLLRKQNEDLEIIKVQESLSTTLFSTY